MKNRRKQNDEKVSKRRKINGESVNVWISENIGRKSKENKVKANRLKE